MIGKAKSISHGINDIRYITGEARNKENPEKINLIHNYFMSNHLDALGIWHAIDLNLARFRPIKNSVVRIELSASKEHTMNFSNADWKQLWDDFIEEFDKQELFDKKGKLVSKKTNLANTIGTVWLHHDSKGGVPHLHGAFSRFDNEGNINNDHNIMVHSADSTMKETLITTTTFICVRSVQLKEWQRSVDGLRLTRFIQQTANLFLMIV